MAALEASGLLDNLQAGFSPGPQRPNPGHQQPELRLIRPDAPQPEALVPEDLQEILGAIAVLDTGADALRPLKTYAYAWADQ